MRRESIRAESTYSATQLALCSLCTWRRWRGTTSQPRSHTEERLEAKGAWEEARVHGVRRCSCWWVRMTGTQHQPRSSLRGSSSRRLASRCPSSGFPAEGTRNVGVSGEVNERAWRFLQAERLTADPVYHPFNFAERPGR